jgi:hypothetical protein
MLTRHLLSEAMASAALGSTVRTAAASAARPKSVDFCPSLSCTAPVDMAAGRGRADRWYTLAAQCKAHCCELFAIVFMHVQLPSSATAPSWAWHLSRSIHDARMARGHLTWSDANETTWKCWPMSGDCHCVRQSQSSNLKSSIMQIESCTRLHDVHACTIMHH